MKIAHDLHIHTNLSACGQKTATLENYLAAAAQLGMKKLAFTNHVWDSVVPGAPEWYRPQNVAHVARLRAELERARGCGAEVIFGCEAEYDYAGRGLSLTEEAAEQFDVILAPNSHTHIVMPKAFYNSPRRHAEFMLQAYEDMLDCSVSRYITAMAHPFHAVNCRPYDFSVPIAQIEDREFTRIFDKTARKGIAVEINLGCVCDLEAESADHIERSPHMRIFRLAKACGCQFIFGSDSHAPESLFRNRWADSVAQILELREEDILPLARI